MSALYPQRIKYWLHDRTQEQKWIVLLSALIISFGIWYFAWESHYLTTHNALKNEIVPLEQKIPGIEKQIEKMQKVLGNPLAREQHEALLNERNDVDNKLKAVSTRLVSSSDMAKALNHIVSGSTELKFLSLENTGNFLLPAIDKQKNTKLYRHDFEVALEGNYFAILNYLKALEKLPWEFYWDMADYEVTTYPQAKITLKLHIVNTEEGLMNA
jgi:MSHA biogenesis protein MshJ